MTLRAAAALWLVDAKAGVALARGSKPYRAGTLRDYERCLDAEILDDLGASRLTDITTRDMDELVARLSRRGLAASTVRNVVMPLRAVFRHAVRREWTTVNPTVGMQVPSGSGRRTRVVDPKAIDGYLAALAVEDRALWATAIFAGLRRGELMALRWADVDLAAGVLRVDADLGGYDQKTRTTQGPKSSAGARSVPLSGGLREVLAEHRARAGARPQGLVFARARLAGTCRSGMEAVPFHDSTTARRARKAWEDAGLVPVTLHECRHTFASLLIAAMAGRGVFNPKLLQRILGHSSIQMTYDRYGHLFPGAEAEVGVMLDELLDSHGSMDVAGSEVAEAVSRLRDALDQTAALAALPVVAQAIDWLVCWRDEHEDEALLASGEPPVAAMRERVTKRAAQRDVRGLA
jgi:integrase